MSLTNAKLRLQLNPWQKQKYEEDWVPITSVQPALCRNWESQKKRKIRFRSVFLYMPKSFIHLFSKEKFPSVKEAKKLHWNAKRTSIRGSSERKESRERCKRVFFPLFLSFSKIFLRIPACIFDASGVEFETGADRWLCNVGVFCLYMWMFWAAATLQHGVIIPALDTERILVYLISCIHHVWKYFLK